MERKTVLKICKEYQILYENRVLSKIPSDFKYPAKAILYSELLLFCSMIEFYKVHGIMVVGDSEWYVSYVLSLFFGDDKKILHFGKSTKEDSSLPLSSLENIITAVGRPSVALRDYLQLFGGMKIAVLFETPKAESALAYVQDCLLSNVDFIGIYGCPVGCRSRKLYNRLNVIFSDDKELVEEFRYMDEDVWNSREISDCAKYVPYGKEVYDIDGEYIRDIHYHSYGATLGIVFNS